jgi:acyl-coenzyme A synthetase/AMP-(fatty) acid ligase
MMPRWRPSARFPSDYRRPKRFFWIDELPRNSYGKVLKRELRARFDRGGARA